MSPADYRRNNIIRIKSGSKSALSAISAGNKNQIAPIISEKKTVKIKIAYEPEPVDLL